jgi:plasmid stability protein
MPSMTIRNLREETKRGIQSRAKRAGHSAEEEARRILDAAVLPPERIKIGSALAAVGRRFGGIDLDIERDQTPAKGVSFEP